MIKSKKILSLFVFCSFSISCVILPRTANAQANTQNSTSIKITTSSVSNEIDTYAQNEFYKQLASISVNPEQYGFKSSEVNNLQLGHAFAVYNLNNDSLSTMKGYYYPVLYNNIIKGIFSVQKNSNGEFTSTLTKSFADKLNTLKNDTFTLINVNGNLFAASKNNSTLIHKGLSKVTNKVSGKLSPSILKQLNRLIQRRNYIIVNINNTPKPFVIYPNKSNNNNRKNNTINTITASKKLPVPIILQGSHPWCWAATAASLINYDKGTSLTAENIVNYTFGKLVDDGGTPDQIAAAYKHWGLTPTEYDTPLSYNSVTSYINNNTPINALMYYNDGYSSEGHSMSLIGYSTSNNGHNTYTMIDPNENYYVSVAATNSGNNVEYNLEGYEFRWYGTIVPSAK